jgi:hypothetical protein
LGDVRESVCGPRAGHRHTPALTRTKIRRYQRLRPVQRIFRCFLTVFRAGGRHDRYDTTTFRISAKHVILAHVPCRYGTAQQPGVPGLPSGAFCRTGVRPGGPGKHQPTESAKRLTEDRHPPVRATRCRVSRERCPLRKLGTPRRSGYRQPRPRVRRVRTSCQSCRRRCIPGLRSWRPAGHGGHPQTAFPARCGSACPAPRARSSRPTGRAR